MPTEVKNWVIKDDSGNILYYLPISCDECPESGLSDWISTGQCDAEFSIESLKITQVDCYDDEQKCYEAFSCKFANLIKKQKMSLAKDIAKNRDKEVFDLKGCDDNWNNIFMRYLIMDAIQCSPYGYYSESTENCLINKLSENCNC